MFSTILINDGHEKPNQILADSSTDILTLSNINFSYFFLAFLATTANTIGTFRYHAFETGISKGRILNKDFWNCFIICSDTILGSQI